MEETSAVERVKEKLLDKDFQKYSLEEELKADPHPTLASFAKKEYHFYKKQMESMYDSMDEPIKFKVSDMLRGKCLFSNVSQINRACSKIV